MDIKWTKGMKKQQNPKKTTSELINSTDAFDTLFIGIDFYISISRSVGIGTGVLK